jgi:hypothetical protein
VWGVGEEGFSSFVVGNCPWGTVLKVKSQKSKVKSQEESLSSFVVCVAHGGSCTLSPTDWKSGATQTKPASAGFKILNFPLVRAGGLGLYSRDFNRQGLVQDLERKESVSPILNEVG